jgi:hypothetical protein
MPNDAMHKINKHAYIGNQRELQIADKVHMNNTVISIVMQY